MAWVKKRRCNIRREDLIAFLSGKSSVPVRHQRHHHHGLHRTASSPIGKAATGRLMLERGGAPRVPLSLGEQDGDIGGSDHQEPDLQPFRDALALQGK